MCCMEAAACLHRQASQQGQCTAKGPQGDQGRSGGIKAAACIHMLTACQLMYCSVAMCVRKIHMLAKLYYFVRNDVTKGYKMTLLKCHPNLCLTRTTCPVPLRKYRSLQFAFLFCLLSGLCLRLPDRTGCAAQGIHVGGKVRGRAVAPLSRAFTYGAKVPPYNPALR